MTQPTETTRARELGPFRRPHGTQLQVTSRKGRKIPIVCPRCKVATREPMYWHADLGHRICDRCWTELNADRIPAALS
ncbi:hypothetical protein IF188_09705 [Microbacterium sp. NEAU-LLC]|uniref:GATA-type domain-containing protein n=1 Tax=Microbacterium helvum TaxID=2773713 RepID=A0ABR8NP62_9MICO|nr:hypothetical protein [Microbacterium helvum]MBD3941969.1 hypothetical protein [Microbacterium helvum]